ncbi:TlpA family protein disulfide reductase [Paenibacillus antri]|uniref:TlpA family protein disulfide reductase n=1 Tax=Paenibacillus antri TaxID=2582848 RepID=A0A5R9GIT3_9BACL|nr:TlpA disulfide reductase family protein [Paenibacillus antri]TLS54240.1 TlpA family protein disulfide reductase [Paenibacillus antri]
MRKTVLALAIVILLAGLAIIQQFATAQTAALPTEEAPKIGYLAPSFELKTLDGGTLGIGRGEREKPVIVNFWASWCDPCRMEAPILSDLYEKYKDRLDIYGVNGLEYDEMTSVQAFVKQYKYEFPTLLDEKSAAFKLYQVPGYPTSFFIDRRGVVQDIVVGLPGHEEFERRLKKLLES